MQKSQLVATMILALALVFAFGCQKESGESNQAMQTQKDLVQCMDEYHRVLRPLMHQALPDEDIAAFKANAEKLLAEAEALADAEVPEKFAGRMAEIDSLRQNILAKTRTFKETCESGTDADIMETFKAAHDDYEVLADIVYALGSAEN